LIVEPLLQKLSVDGDASLEIIGGEQDILVRPRVVDKEGGGVSRRRREKRQRSNSQQCTSEASHYSPSKILSLEPIQDHDTMRRAGIITVHFPIYEYFLEFLTLLGTLDDLPAH